MTEQEPAGWFTRLTRTLETPCDAAGLSVFRMMFGAVMFGAVIRFAALGRIAELYANPNYHFTYLGFDWITPWPLWGLYLHFGVMALAALALALGYYTRVSAALFFVLFTYAELFDKSVYLNHYYLVTLLSLLLVMLPAGATWSLDARRSGARRVPRFAYWLLRAQMSIVYFYAGFAKLNSDWLWQAQPLTLWLGTFTDVPVFGRLVEQHWLAVAMSWAGMVYDLSVAPLLWWRKTRPFAFAAAVAFHVSVWLMFPIGVFPWVMLTGATAFFEPDWPRRWLGRFAHEAPSADLTRRAIPSAWLLGAGLYLALQALLPLRYLLYPGWVNWTEQGFRFSWRVMLIEKAGQVEYSVVSPGRNQTFRVYPRRELTSLQYRMLSTQPDMIHQYALHLKERFQKRGIADAQVYARAWVSLNGRPSQPIVDPDFDLASVPRSLAPSPFIVPLAD